MSEFFGQIVTRRDSPEDTPFAAGQTVESYVLEGPLPRSEPTPLDGRTVQNAHAEARRFAPEVRRLVDDKAWRKGKVHRCTCKRAPALVTEVVAPDARRWAFIVQGKEIPPAFRGKAAGPQPAPLAWPLHHEPNGYPHIELLVCPRCDKTHAVALTATSIHLIPTRPRYGVQVTD